MKALTVYAHNNPRSFCHGVLERFTAGLEDAGHSNEFVDLYAIKFDPVLRQADGASYISADIPTDILDRMNLRGQVLDSCRWPGQRWLAERALRGKSQAEIAALIRSHMPKDVLAQQAKVAAADALAFIAPIHFCHFPSILKGWIDRSYLGSPELIQQWHRSSPELVALAQCARLGLGKAVRIQRCQPDLRVPLGVLGWLHADSPSLPRRLASTLAHRQGRCGRR